MLHNWHFVRDFLHLKATRSPLDLNDAVMDESWRDKGLQDVGPPLHHCVVAARLHEIVEVSAADVPDAQRHPLIPCLVVPLRFVGVGCCGWQVQGRIQAHPIFLIERLVDLGELHVLKVLLEDVTFFRGEVPRLRHSLPHDHCVGDTEGELRGSSSALRPQLVDEPL